MGLPARRWLKLVRAPRSTCSHVLKLSIDSAAEPLDDVLPPQKSAESVKGGYPLVFDFSKPIPLPPAKKVRHQVAERLGQNQPTTSTPGSVQTSKAPKTNGNALTSNLTRHVFIYSFRDVLPG